jgi:hypothetical protein
MNANELIESYVTDVALKLPRTQRNDVAFELRALLNEELQAKADAAGRTADAAMAMELLQAFGRPADVAARYRPTLTIIDPADGHAFLRATLIGLAVIWCAGLLEVLQQPIGSGWDVLTVLSRWWWGAVSVVVSSLWWPGVLVVGFAMSARSRRRRPHTAVWTPRADRNTHVNRFAMAASIVGIVCGVSVLIEPRWLLDLFWNGRAAPAAYEALTYTDTFRHRQAPVLLVLLLLNVPLMIAAIVRGQRSTVLRRMETGLSLVICAAMLWTVLDGPVFMAASGDSSAKFAMVIIIAITLISYGIQSFRRIRPKPNRHVQAQP